MGLGRKFFSNVWGKPEWDLPSEEEVMEIFLNLKNK